MSEAQSNFRVHQLPPFLMAETARAVALLRNAGTDVVDLSQLNPNLPPPAAAVEKLVQACLQPHNHRYSSSQGILKLREEFARFYRERFGVDICPQEEVVITLGTKQGLSHLLFAVLHAGDSVILPTPGYPIHSACISLAGAQSISVALPGSGSSVLDGKAEEFFEQLVARYESTWPRPSMILVSFPHNPAGAVVTRCFFERLVQCAREWKLSIVHDFTYGELAYDGFHTPSLFEASGAKECGVEFYSLSKSFSMPGWRVGAAVGNRELVGALRKIKSFLDCGVFQPLQIGAIKALESNTSILAGTAELYRARRDVLVKGLQALGFECHPPLAGLFVWAKLPESVRREGSRRWCLRLLEEGHVAATPGISFDLHSEEFVRFALVENEARIRAALQRMERVL